MNDTIRPARPGGLLYDLDRTRDEASSTDGGPPSIPHWLQTAMPFGMGPVGMGLGPSALAALWASSAPPSSPSALPRSGWDPSSPSLWYPPFGGNAGFPAQPISDDPFTRAAFRTRQSVQPDGGRLEGAATSVLENYLPHVANQLQTLPQRAFEASERLRLTGQYDPGPAVETALMMLGLRGLPAIAHRPGIARRSGEHWDGAINPMASKSASLYNFPVKPQRPFELDYPPAKYPHGALADATGRLTHDIEGRPLVAERVVGRRLLGGADEALSPAEINTVGTQLTGRAPEVVAGREIGGNAGLFTVRPDAAGNATYNVLVNRALSPTSKNSVVAHEVGHAINYFAAPRRGIPQEGIKTELNRNYNVGVTGRERDRSLTLPQHQGYKPHEVPDELMAEAIRAYNANPNYFKTVAPRTAAQIREWWNSHPTLSKHLQFNSVAGTAGAAGQCDAADKRGRILGGVEAGRRSVSIPIASKNASLYNPRVKPQRSFELDYPPKYPHGAPADATGRLTHDIEGRPLVADRVVGRRTLGGPDEVLTPAELDAIGTRLIGRPPEVVAGREIGGNAGLFAVHPDAAGNTAYYIFVNRAYPANSVQSTTTSTIPISPTTQTTYPALDRRSAERISV